ncbi:MAG: hypothetical protein GY875_09370 [Gammaproteobacteria bacterium]|nr:hypothetical protein [Gammaproteobacteria bacterium]
MTAVYRLIFILNFSFLCSNLYASPQVIDQNSARQTFPLNGVWHLSVNDFEADILVPTGIPFLGGVSKWTKQIELNISQAPAVAIVEFKGIAGSAIVKMNDIEVGVLHPFAEKRIDVAGSCWHYGVHDSGFDCDIAIENPKLWSTDNPRLYDVFVSLYTSDGRVDTVYDRTGIKKTEIRGNAFYLNNKRLFLRGITRQEPPPVLHSPK